MATIYNYFVQRRFGRYWGYPALVKPSEFMHQLTEKEQGQLRSGEAVEKENNRFTAEPGGML